MLIGALEAGGTNMTASVGNPQRGVMQRASFPTAAPETTIPQIVEFIRAFDVQALGIGSFGPLDLNPASPTYGCITGTPKKVQNLITDAVNGLFSRFMFYYLATYLE